MRRSALSAAVVIAIGGLAAGSTSAATVKQVGRAGSSSFVDTTIVKVAPATTLPNRASLAGAIAQTQPVHIEVALKLRNREQLDSFLQSQRNAVSGSSMPTLSSGAFASQYSPTEKQAEAVADFLTRSGFTNVSIAGNRLLVSADTTADLAQAAFRTTLARVTTADGRDAFANTDAVSIPASLQDTILAVLGLQTVYQGHTMNTPSPDAVTGHNPLEWSSIYGATGVATAAGVTAGIITQGKITQSITDLNTFTSQNGLASVTTQTVTVGSTSNDASGVTEWDIDSQDIVGMAGGQIGKLVFYNIPTLSTANLVAGFNKGVVDNVAKIINVSIGGCETGNKDGSAAAGDQVFAQAVAQGQTFSISTGDTGADECGDGGITPSWPANSQYVLAISGTRLNASTTTWSSEVVWNALSQPNGGATGGSQSTYEPKPSWQTLWSGPRRGVADVAFEGDPDSGAKVIVNGGIQQWGGTSLAAPIFAGLWARVIAVKGTGVGFAGPLIYQLPAGDFHDVTSGNNDGSTAGPGYDLATGRGSVILSSAINHIGGGTGGNVPPVANFSFTTSGLTANFTDSSTDSDGSISSRAWNFGDGGTSTATNPSHAYTAGGTYNVGLTVTDNGGASNTKTQSVTVSSGGGGTSTQILANTGFESGTTPWTGTTADICTTSCGAQSPHAGTHFVWLDGYGSTHTETIAQQIAIPAGKTAATLQYYLHIDTAETTATAYDTLKVQVLNTSGTVLATLSTYSNLNKNSGYTVHTNSLAPYIGQTVVIKFTGAEDSSLQTSFVLDDVTLTVQ